ncbi:MAG TPA: putative sulfate/molybdate transporter [Halococcus sp.]|nr:putative sulfate/molybdate transporter [Halococcus sp.]
MSVEFGERRSIDFSTSELTGAIGDSVTMLPIVVAVAALTDLPLAGLLIWFAVFQVVWGVHYRLPVSVEPMKALAALVIAGALSTTELAIAGLLAGACLLTIGTSGTLGRIERYIGQPVVRGIQLAVALILLETGVKLGFESIALAVGAVGVAALVAVLGYRRASALCVLGLGALVALTQTGIPTAHLPTFALPTLSVAALSPAAIEGTAAQLAMSVGNAAVATSLLLGDYFDADVSADELATSMGVMNLVAVPLGGLPMCHGSGGVAGKYAFGARSAGANLILGVLYVVAAVFAVGVVAAFPLSVLGVILVLVALELGRAGLDTEHLPLTLAVGVLGLLTNVGIAFVVGAACYLVLDSRMATV